MLGDTVEITEGYRTWWSYIPHFMGTPGYVYAYSYGQLLALSVYRAYEQRGDDVRAAVPRAAGVGRVTVARGAGRDRRARPRRSRLLERWPRHRGRAARSGRDRGEGIWQALSLRREELDHGAVWNWSRARRRGVAVRRRRARRHRRSGCRRRRHAGGEGEGEVDHHHQGLHLQADAAEGEGRQRRSR